MPTAYTLHDAIEIEGEGNLELEGDTTIGMQWQFDVIPDYWGVIGSDAGAKRYIPSLVRLCATNNDFTSPLLYVTENNEFTAVDGELYQGCYYSCAPGVHGYVMVITSP